MPVETGWIDVEPNLAPMATASWVSLPDGRGGRRVFQDIFVRPVQIERDSSGVWWIAAENGLGRVLPASFDHVPDRDLPYVWSIVEDSSGVVWFGSFDHGLFRAEPDSLRAHRVGLPAHLLNAQFFASAGAGRRRPVAFRARGRHHHPGRRRLPQHRFPGDDLPSHLGWGAQSAPRRSSPRDLCGASGCPVAGFGAHVGVRTRAYTRTTISKPRGSTGTATTGAAATPV